MLGRAALLVAVLLLSSSLMAQTSEPASPLHWGKPEPGSPDSPYPKAAPDLRGTKQVPLAVEVVRSEPGEEKERRERERGQQKAAEEHGLEVATWALVGVTFGLAVFTALLYWSTRRIAIDSKEASSAALAASTSARVADEETRRTLQRSYISGGGTVIDFGTRFRITVHNHGGTAARLRWIWYGYIYFDPADEPIPPYSERVSWVDSIGPGMSHHRVAAIPIPHPKAEQTIFVRFVYDDIYFGECTAGFIMRTIPGNPDPEPIAAPEAYTARTECGSWIAPELPTKNKDADPAKPSA
jgi:hypothetical protein